MIVAPAARAACPAWLALPAAAARVRDGGHAHIGASSARLAVDAMGGNAGKDAREHAAPASREGSGSVDRPVASDGLTRRREAC